MLLAPLGTAVRVRVEDPQLGATVRAVLRDLLENAGGAGPGSAASVDVRGTGPFDVISDEHSVTVSTAEEALTHAATAVNLTAVARTPTLASHSAVLARGGTAVVIPGRSGLGKTTLTAALVQRGWDYVTDEALALQWDDPRLMPYPRALALSPWSQRALGLTAGIAAAGESFYRASDLGPGRTAPDVAGVGHVIILERNGGPPSLAPVHRSTVLAELLRRSFTHHRNPARALTLYTSVLASADCLLLRLGSPTEAADLVTKTIG